MKRLRRALNRPLKLLRKLAGQQPTPLETALLFSVYNNVAGDYLEFGVFKGSSFAHAYRYFNDFHDGYKERNKLGASQGFANLKRRFFAFDSFEGLPPVEQADLPAHWRGAGAMASPQDFFIGRLREAHVDLNDVVIVPGFYNVSLKPEVLEKHSLKAAAIVHVDCDLYESTVDVLNFIRPIVVDGCTIIFDDWYYYKGHPKKGERGAFEDWLARNPDLIASPLCSQFPAKAFILNHRDA